MSLNPLDELEVVCFDASVRKGFTVCGGVKFRDSSVFSLAAAKSFRVLGYKELRCVTGLKDGDMV